MTSEETASVVVVNTGYDAKERCSDNLPPPVYC